MTMNERRDLRDLCAQTHDDDGIDPRRLKKEVPTTKPSRKDMQLCKQVWRCLESTLACASDVVLEGVVIVCVEPDPHAGRLRVSVVPREHGVEGSLILERLRAARGLLRASLAGTVQRKRLPELIFALGARPEVDHE